MGFKAKARKAKVAEGKPIMKKRRKKVVTKVESDCEDQGCSGCCPPSPSRPVAQSEYLAGAGLKGCAVLHTAL